ncbi:hypothetical protein [Myxococcus sp. AS-1-15]|uniref:hypothetical protein n=1 Tax=Myxococcus sp. AS-1-15 TaxID=2874600 RepID=UPI001CC14A99|nr:hypothetical protein [Myxococcus sp. AS-1-15]MBZ4394922.1 hypothetical protein [Myxococcus sp. AS-1-15]BDT36532.1 hypothetical protein MFMH1_62010 [Myxococcus sp. MH1]
MMRGWLLLGLCVSTQAWAQDYRACKELFVSPLAAKVESTNASGSAWDEGSSADPELTAMAVDVEGASPVVIGPKQEDASVLLWNSLFLEETRSGAWLPVGVGGSLHLLLTDSDEGPSDFIGAFSVTVPESLAQTGTAFILTSSTGTQQMPLTLRVSATDGKRTCAGLEKAGPVRYELPAPMFTARVDNGLFEKIRGAQRCKAGSTQRECKPESYDVLYTPELLKDTWVTLVSGGPFAGTPGKFFAMAFGIEPARRQVAYVGRCDAVKKAPALGETLACVLGNKATLISIEKGKPKTRAANARELEALKEPPADAPAESTPSP